MSIHQKAYLRWTSVVILFGLIGVLCCRVEVEQYGQSISEGPVLPLADVIQDSDEYLGKTVVVQARIGDVCQTSGCWCFLEEDGIQLYVSMSTFTLPPEASTRKCIAEGKLVMRNDRLTLLATGFDLI